MLLTIESEALQICVRLEPNHVEGVGLIDVLCDVIYEGSSMQRMCQMVGT